MQFDHRRLTFFRDIGAQRRRRPKVREAANGNVLIARDVDEAREYCGGDDTRRREHHPCQGVVAGHGGIAFAAKCNRRRLGGVHHREPKGIERVEERQQNARQNCRLKERADRDHRRLAQIGQGIGTACRLRTRFLCGGIDVARQRAQKNDDNRGRDDLAQSARGRDHAG